MPRNESPILATILYYAALALLVAGALNLRWTASLGGTLLGAGAALLLFTIWFGGRGRRAEASRPGK